MTEISETVEAGTTEVAPEAAPEPEQAPVQLEAEPAGDPETADSPAATYKAIVDGQEVEVSIDDLLSGYQKSSAADKRFQEAAELRKQADAERQTLLERLKTDPAAIMSEYDIDPDEFAEARLAAKIEEELMDPNEREKRRLEAELEQYKAEEERKREEAEQQQYQVQVQQHAKDWGDKLDAAFNELGAPKNPYRVKLAVDAILSAMDRGVDLSPKQAVEAAYNAAKEDLSSAAVAFKGQALLDYLGKDVVKEVQKALAGQVKNTLKKAPETQRQAAQVEDKGPKKSFEQLMRELRGGIR